MPDNKKKIEEEKKKQKKRPVTASVSAHQKLLAQIVMNFLRK